MFSDSLIILLDSENNITLPEILNDIKSDYKGDFCNMFMGNNFNQHPGNFHSEKMQFKPNNDSIKDKSLLRPKAILCKGFLCSNSAPVSHG